MKKNLLGLIASVFGSISVFFLGSPMFVRTGASGEVAEKTSIVNLVLSGEGLSVLIILSSLACFMALIHVIRGIVQEENSMPVVLSCSVINAFTVFFSTFYLVQRFKPKSSYYYASNIEPGWGIIIVLLLYTTFFLLSLIGFILSLIAERKDTKANRFNKLYQYKRLLDAGIIDRVEYDKYKNQYLP